MNKITYWRLFSCFSHFFLFFLCFCSPALKVEAKRGAVGLINSSLPWTVCSDAAGAAGRYTCRYHKLLVLPQRRRISFWCCLGPSLVRARRVHVPVFITSRLRGRLNKSHPGCNKIDLPFMEQQRSSFVVTQISWFQSLEMRGVEPNGAEKWVICRCCDRSEWPSPSFCFTRCN